MAAIISLYFFDIDSTAKSLVRFCRIDKKLYLCFWPRYMQRKKYY